MAFAGATSKYSMRVVKMKSGATLDFPLILDGLKTVLLDLSTFIISVYKTSKLVLILYDVNLIYLFKSDINT